MKDTDIDMVQDGVVRAGDLAALVGAMLWFVQKVSTGPIPVTRKAERKGAVGGDTVEDGGSEEDSEDGMASDRLPDRMKSRSRSEKDKKFQVRVKLRS